MLTQFIQQQQQQRQKRLYVACSALHWLVYVNVCASYL
jgi:hypothetical protein